MNNNEIPQTTNTGLADVDSMPGHILQSTRYGLLMGHIMNSKRSHYTFTLALLLVATMTATAFVYSVLYDTTVATAVINLIVGLI